MKMIDKMLGRPSRSELVATIAAMTETIKMADRAFENVRGSGSVDPGLIIRAHEAVRDHLPFVFHVGGHHIPKFRKEQSEEQLRSDLDEARRDAWNPDFPKSYRSEDDADEARAAYYAKREIENELLRRGLQINKGEA